MADDLMELAYTEVKNLLIAVLDPQDATLKELFRMGAKLQNDPIVISWNFQSGIDSRITYMYVRRRGVNHTEIYYMSEVDHNTFEWVCITDNPPPQ